MFDVFKRMGSSSTLLYKLETFLRKRSSCVCPCHLDTFVASKWRQENRSLVFSRITMQTINFILLCPSAGISTLIVNWPMLDSHMWNLISSLFLQTKISRVTRCVNTHYTNIGNLKRAHLLSLISYFVYM